MRTYNVTDLKQILLDMAEYADEWVAQGEANDYFQEIVETGLFHDAIGKVCENDGDTIFVTDEY